VLVGTNAGWQRTEDRSIVFSLEFTARSSQFESKYRRGPNIIRRRNFLDSYHSS
jgi:hypothetical protein